MRASRTPQKLEEWKNKVGLNASTGTFKEEAIFVDLIVLSVKGTGSESKWSE